MDVGPLEFREWPVEMGGKPLGPSPQPQRGMGGGALGPFEWPVGLGERRMERGAGAAIAERSSRAAWRMNAVFLSGDPTCRIRAC